MNRQIMYMEDNGAARDRYSQLLRDQGFEVTVCSDKKEAVLALRTKLPDLALLDVSHHGDRDAGYEVCSEIRRVSAEVPVVFLTNRHGEVDRISGFRLGADDYICKPFSPREVVARVRAVLRRSVAANPEADPNQPLRLDRQGRSASVFGHPLNLTEVEYRLLELIAQRPGRVWSRSQLLDQAYSDYRDVSDRAIDSHIKNLRRKLDATAPHYRWIHSVYGVGYRFEPEPVEDAT